MLYHVIRIRRFAYTGMFHDKLLHHSPTKYVLSLETWSMLQLRATELPLQVCDGLELTLYLVLPPRPLLLVRL